MDDYVMVRRDVLDRAKAICDAQLQRSGESVTECWRRTKDLHHDAMKLLPELLATAPTPPIDWDEAGLREVLVEEMKSRAPAWWAGFHNKGDRNLIDLEIALAAMKRVAVASPKPSYTLSEKAAYAKFSEACENPPPANEKLKKLFRDDAAWEASVTPPKPSWETGERK